MSTPEPVPSSLTARASWLLVGKTIGFACTVAIPMLLVRRMPDAEFGLYKQVFLVINGAVNMLPLGFGMSAFYFLPRDDVHRRHTVFNVVLFTTAIAALFGVLLMLFPTTLILLFREPAAVDFAPWIGAIAMLWVVGSFLEIVTVANHEIRMATSVVLGMQMSRALFFLVAAAASGTIRSVLVAAVAQGLIQVAVLLVYLSSRFPRFWRALDFSFLRRQLAYALPFGLAGLLYALQSDLHNYFVSQRFGPAVYAVYAIGCFQLPLFGILGEAVASVMIPRVSALQGRGETREIVLLTVNAMRKLALVCFPAYAFLLILRREFIVTLFTTRYLESVPVFAVNLALIPLGVMLLDPIMRAHPAHRAFLVKLHAAILIGLFVGLPAAIDRFGLLGAIVLVVVSNAAGRLATMAKVVKILQMDRRDLALFADVAKTALAAAAAGIVTAVLRPFAASLPPPVTILVCGICFAAAYLVAIVSLGIVTVEERTRVVGNIWRMIGRPSPGVARAAVPLVRE